MNHAQGYIERESETKWSANNYHPLAVVIEKGVGCWVWDVDGNRYLDMLAAYLALSQGHCHPKIISVLTNQANKLTLISRAFHNDKMGIFLKILCELTGYEKTLPMKSGVEAVELATKMACKWGEKKKGVPKKTRQRSFPAKIILPDGPSPYQHNIASGGASEITIVIHSFIPISVGVLMYLINII
ncbi:MAG: aminotransferase class III-fold pyridoxal phosphate-dependent enzyme [Thermotogota bacterium]